MRNAHVFGLCLGTGIGLSCLLVCLLVLQCLSSITHVTIQVAQKAGTTMTQSTAFIVWVADCLGMALRWFVHLFVWWA